MKKDLYYHAQFMKMYIKGKESWWFILQDLLRLMNDDCFLRKVKKKTRFSETKTPLCGMPVLEAL